jgi:hypothetical protein
MAEMNNRLSNTLLSVIVFLKHKAEEKDLKPIISVAKLVDMLKSSGLRITYQQLVELTNDPKIKSSIKSINKNQIEFNLGGDTNETPSPTEQSPEFNLGDDGEENAGQDQSDEDFNPDDFAIPEDGTGDEGVENPMEEPQQVQANYQQPSVVSQMAKRALNRPD